MTDTVYLLWFISHEPEERDDGLLIGVYDSELEAQKAIERLRGKLGFSSLPEGFQIHSQRLNKDSWTEGFVTYE